MTWGGVGLDLARISIPPWPQAPHSVRGDIEQCLAAFSAACYSDFDTDHTRSAARLSREQVGRTGASSTADRSFHPAEFCAVQRTCYNMVRTPRLHRTSRPDRTTI